MFRKIRLFYYNNKHKLWFGLGIFILICIIIQIINYAIRKNNQEKMQSERQNTLLSQQYTPTTTSPIVSNNKISQTTLKKDTEIIEQFITYGNSNNVEEAYNLLSQDCKDEMYQTIEKFYNNYFKKIFSEKKSYDVKTWIEYNDNVTYRIKYFNDIMATGTINEEFIEDYFTVIVENEEKRLNINQFINKIQMKEKEEVDGLEVSIINKYTYYDYVQYEFVFKNNSESKIILDTKENTESVYIKGDNDVKYDWFGNEIPNEYLILDSGESRTFRIKFNKLYNPERIEKSINFTDIRKDGDNEIRVFKIDI